MAKRMLPIFLKARDKDLIVTSAGDFTCDAGVDILHPIDFVEDLAKLPAGESIYTCAIHREDYRGILATAANNGFIVHVKNELTID